MKPVLGGLPQLLPNLWVACFSRSFKALASVSAIFI
jgi:hypothetical protein